MLLSYYDLFASHSKSQHQISRSRLRSSLEITKTKSNSKKWQKTKGLERKLETSKGIDILIRGSQELEQLSGYEKVKNNNINNNIQLILLGTKWYVIRS
jgi:hypothetical protein